MLSDILFFTIDVLDGLMIVLATYCLNILHPGYLLADVIEEERRAKSSGSNPRDSMLPLVRVQNYVDPYDDKTLPGSKSNSMTAAA